jgi:hypothetical protein
MIRVIKTLAHVVTFSVVGTTALFINDGYQLTNPATSSLESQSLVANAEARIGRPGTPMSYAGVARRTHRRALYGAAAVGAATYGAYNYGTNYYGNYNGYGPCNNTYNTGC